MSGKRPYVTQKDVARLANVSQSAVAAALGGTSKIRVSEETRQRVLQAAAQLNYTPNQSASITRSGRSRQVALLVLGTLLQTVFHRLRRLAICLEERGLRVVPFDLQWMNRTLEQAWDEALAARAEGIILSSSFGTIHPPMHRRLLNSPVPVVSLCGPSIPGIPLIAPDFRSAFRELTSELIRRKRRRLAFLKRYRKEDPIRQIDWKRAERTLGFLDAVQDAGLKESAILHEVWNHHPEHPLNEHDLGALGLEELLAKGPPPDALVCANDNFALGVLTAARRHGVDIPRQMAVTGCDGEEWTRYGALPITTISQPSNELAERAAEVMSTLLQGGTAPEEPVLLPCEICWRESS